MSTPVPYWRGDRDFFPRNDPRRSDHLARIEVQNRINARICASAGDGSYSVVVTKRDVE